MAEFVINIAKINIKINSIYDYCFNRCKDYIVDTNNIDIYINNTIEEIKEYSIDNNLEISEFLLIYEKIASKLNKFNCLLLHGASIAYKDNAYLFLASSGVGKSTHIKYLRQYNKDIKIINGDKPIIDTNGYIYGTPWAGKENWQDNVNYKLKSIILLKRDKYDHVNKINKQDHISDILNQIYRNNNILDNITILDSALKNTNIYELYATNSISAAEVCFKEIIDEN